MAEENKRRSPLDMLYEIVGDLWPKDYIPPEPKDDKPVTAGKTETPKETPKEARQETPVPAAPPKPVPPPFEEYWRRADERVEWTQALMSPVSPDGLTDPRLWRFLHDHAERVLRGDTAAYAEVLRHVDPLADLKPYAGSVTVSASDSDHVKVNFTARPDLLTDTVNARRLLAGLALRCARDVLALLPVNAVAVEGRLPEGDSLSVEYQRDPLRKARFGFIDPVDFAVEQGGVFAEPDRNGAPEA